MKEADSRAAEIMALEREWCSRLKAKDVDWIVNLHDAEGVQLPPGGEPVTGREGLRSAWNAMANTEGLEISWEPKQAQVSASGDMAYDYGTATIRMPDGRSQAAKYAVVWVRRNGEWKIALDTFNANS